MALTQLDVANKSDTSRRTVAAIERGEEGVNLKSFFKVLSVLSKRDQDLVERITSAAAECVSVDFNPVDRKTNA